MRTRVYDPAMLFVVVATVALSFKGILAKFVYAAGGNVDMLLLVRFTVAAPLFWLGAWWIHGRIGGIDRCQWLQCIGAGFLFFLATYFDFSALVRIDAGLSRLILFTFPLFVVLITSLIDRRWPTLQQVLAFAVAYVGLMLMLAPDGTILLSSTEWQGVGYALAASLSYALYLVASQGIMKRMSSSRFTAASGTTTLVLVLLFLLVSGEWQSLEYSSTAIGWSVVISVACTVLPFFLLYEAIKRCGASRASLISLTGPAMTILFAGWLLGESFNAIQLIGVLLTTCGVAILELKSLTCMVKRLRSNDQPQTGSA